MCVCFPSPAYQWRMKGYSIQPQLQWQILFLPPLILPQCPLHPTSVTPICHLGQICLADWLGKDGRMSSVTLLQGTWRSRVEIPGPLPPYLPRAMMSKSRQVIYQLLGLTPVEGSCGQFYASWFGLFPLRPLCTTVSISFLALLPQAVPLCS